MRCALWVGVAVLTALSGCGRDYGVRCEDAERYAGGREIPPVRVPDDLSVPDEAQALRIPQVARSAPSLPQASGRGACLESPPPYSEVGSGEGVPGAAPEAADAE